MIPQAAQGFKGSGLPESTPYLLTLSGYLLIFFVEKIAFDTHHLLEKEGEDVGVKVQTDGKTSVVVNSAGAPSGRSAIILLVALGLHALMETMALGLSSNRVNAGLLALSIALHQV